MAEQYDVAAIRHLRSAEHLELGGHIDDAGYHVGLCAENAVKSAMRESGLEAYWFSQGKKAFRASPMKGHWSTLQQRISAAVTEINLHASGRRAAPLRHLAAQGPNARFANWSIDIRYADPDHVPVTAGSLDQWKNDAATFIFDFVMV